METILTLREASAFLKISEYTLRRMARDSEIPAIRLSKSWRFRMKDLDHWLSSKASSHHVLVIDDDDRIRELMTDLLTPLGLRVTTAEGGVKGIALFKEGEYDLVLLDLVMPDCTGVEVMKHIRELSYDMPVIVLTGYPESSLVAKILEHGPMTLMKKPFPARKLASYIQRAVSHTAIRS